MELRKVELFEQIRRDFYLLEKSIRQIARERQIHRREVRSAVADAVPPKRKQMERNAPVLTLLLRAVVDDILKTDRRAPRKQRHTARRIFARLKTEHGFCGAESTVRKYVGARRRELVEVRDAFVPLAHLPGDEGEVDWYEAVVEFPWGEETAQFFQMRACSSGREFHMAFPRQTQQAFLEGHVAAYSHLGGVFHVMRYDNLSAAVKRVLRGRRREETTRFIALRSHYLFEGEFCLAGEEGAHEKGGVEGGVGRFRRTHLVPVPKVESYAELNRLLMDACTMDDLRVLEGRQRTVAEDWEKEQEALLPLPAEPFSCVEVSEGRVDKKGRVKVKTNHYSVPIRLRQMKVEIRVHARRVEVVHGGALVAVHERLQGLHGESLQLDHYLELLWRKPGALARSRPLAQARAEGTWPAEYDLLWQELRDRYGEADGTRQLLDVLMMHREWPSDEVHRAVERALDYGCYDAGAIAVLLRQQTAQEPSAAPLADLGILARYERPPTSLGEYDQLLRALPISKEVH